jgi:hypothetical protein
MHTALWYNNGGIGRRLGMRCPDADNDFVQEKA